MNDGFSASLRFRSYSACLPVKKVIALENVTKRYGPVVALDNLTDLPPALIS
jgi:hypothetical protein